MSSRGALTTRRYSFSGVSSETMTFSGLHNYKINIGGAGRVRLTIPGEGRVRVTASGAVSTSIDRRGTGPYKIVNSGAGRMKISGDGTGELHIEQSGAGKLEATHSGDEDVYIECTGTGRVLLDNFGRAKVYVTASGRGSVRINGDPSRNRIQEHSGFAKIFFGSDEVVRRARPSRPAIQPSSQICNFSMQHRRGHNVIGFGGVFYQIPSNTSMSMTMINGRVYFNNREFADFREFQRYIERTGERL